MYICTYKIGRGVYRVVRHNQVLILQILGGVGIKFYVMQLSETGESNTNKVSSEIDHVSHRS
jgi:hypothetical protein